MENIFLIVGLGNPGAEYAKTRHNAGFLLVEKLAAHWKCDWGDEKKFRARIAKVDLVGRASSLALTGKTPVPRRILLCEPQTFMNLSGETVGALANFYQLPLARILIATDDADLPVGMIRLRANGSSGGHHGLESIEQHLASREFARLKIGIGRKDGLREITNHVLEKFDSAESKTMEKVLGRAVEQIEIWLDAGIEKAMQLNGSVEMLKN